jgi:hypothetical protein
MALRNLVLVGYLSMNLLAPATGYSYHLGEPRPVVEETETLQNRFEKGERKSRFEGDINDEFCGGLDNPCGPDNKDNNESDDGDGVNNDSYLLHPPIPVHDPVRVKRNKDNFSELEKEAAKVNEGDNILYTGKIKKPGKVSEDSKPAQVIDFTKPEDEAPVISESAEFKPEAKVDGFSELEQEADKLKEGDNILYTGKIKKSVNQSTASDDSGYKSNHILLEQLTPIKSKKSYFDKGVLHFKWTATTCVSSTGKYTDDLAYAIMEVEKSFKEEFGIKVKYDHGGNHTYDSGKGITDLSFKLGKNGDQYCAEIDARINPLLRK